MSRRARALVFGLLALAAAAFAAAIAEDYGARVARSYGPLRAVVVAQAPLRAGERIGPGRLGSTLVTRRVPARFVPPGTLARPEDAVGLEPRAEITPGSYVAAALLRPPGRATRPRVHGLRRGQRPVQITVTGAGALLAGPRSAGAAVDVVVTTEPTGVGAGRTYVAATAVPLLAIEPAGASPGPGASAAATLGLTRPQALDLIAAQNFARQVTLLPSGT